MNPNYSTEPDAFVPENLQLPPRALKPKFPAVVIALLVAVSVMSCGVLVLAWPRAKPAFEGQAWQYKITDLELENHLSPEMSVYSTRQFELDLKLAGNDGWELVSAIPLPSGESKALRYRFIYRQPGKPSAGMREFEMSLVAPEAGRKAIEAESKAQSEAFEQKLSRLGGGQ